MRQAGHFNEGRESMEHRADSVGQVTLGGAIERNRGLQERAEQLAMRARNIANRLGGPELAKEPPRAGEPAAAMPALSELGQTQNGLTRALEILEAELERLDRDLGLPERDNQGLGSSGPQRLRRVGEG